MSSQGSAPAMELPPDTDRGAALIGIWWSMSAIVILTIAMRYWARIKIGCLGIDDWLMLLTAVLFVESSAITTYYASIGGTRHLFYLTPSEARQAIKFNWLAQPCAIFALATSKASVAFLVLRLLGPHDKFRRWILYFIIVTITLLNSLGVVFTFVQCTPVDALWDRSIPSHCWDPHVQASYNYFNGAWNIIVDIILACMPATFIVKLNMSTAHKIRLSVLLGLGLIASAFATVKVYYLSLLTARADLTYLTFDTMCWAGAELMLIVLCGSIPTMKPLYDEYGKWQGLSKWYGSVGRSNGSNFQKSWLGRLPKDSKFSSGVSDGLEVESFHSAYSNSQAQLNKAGEKNAGITVTRDYVVATSN